MKKKSALLGVAYASFVVYPACATTFHPNYPG